jgi:hypothetical protein
MAQAEGCGVNATENRFYREKADHDAAAGIKASHANAIAKLVMMRTYLTLEQQEAFDTEWLAKRGAISARSRAEAGLPTGARRHRRRRRPAAPRRPGRRAPVAGHGRQVRLSRVHP